MKLQTPTSVTSEDVEMPRIESEIRSCNLCTLSNTRKKAVPGEGPRDAKIMLIGEGPGHHENEQGVPFVGAAGKLLDQLLENVGLQRSDVYITNVVKCRPPGNRDPQPIEIEACSKYLDRQIDLINPRVIVTLGRFSMSRWFHGVRISDIHGQAKRDGNRWVVPMFHPAAALHNSKYRPLLVEDFKKLPQLAADSRIDESASDENRKKSGGEPPVEQLSLL